MSKKVNINGDTYIQTEYGTLIPLEKYMEKGLEKEVQTDDSAFNEVSKPKHYNREGAMQCFDEFVLIYGIEAAKYACLFNIHKYRYRAADKNGQQDLSKSDWYMNKYKELCEI